MNLRTLTALPTLTALVLLGGAPHSTAAAATNTTAVAPAPDLATNAAARVTTLDPKLPTLFVAGDSTAARGTGEAQQGWAVPFANYFDAAKVNVANRARGGRSSRTFIT